MNKKARSAVQFYTLIVKDKDDIGDKFEKTKRVFLSMEIGEKIKI